MSDKTRLAIVVSHPIQHFAPWHREVAKLSDLELKVLFCCDWGCGDYFDPGFRANFKWDVPLLEGYDYEFLPISRRPTKLNHWQVDNPTVSACLDRICPQVVKIFGYTYKTNWRVRRWTQIHKIPLMLYSDSNIKADQVSGAKSLVKRSVVGHFYRGVDGALFVGDNNYAYHRRYGLEPGRLFPGCLPIDTWRLTKATQDRATVRAEVREKYRIPIDAFVVIFSGKLTPWKRPLDVLRAAHGLYTKGHNVWAIFAGEGTQRPMLEQYCRDNCVPNAVIAGFVNQSEMPMYYAASDLIVVSSEQDPHPLVITEAGSFGLPTVASDAVGCIGLHDTARPNVNAVVYPCGSVSSLAQGILTLKEDRQLHSRMSEASERISRTQDVTVAAENLIHAVTRLRELGKRSRE